MRNSIILTGIIIIVFFLSKSLGFDHLIHPQKWIILSFFVAISYLFHLLIKQGMANKRENFVQFYLATIVIRFLLSILFIGFELYYHVQKPLLFIINFFVLYLFYTIFEISNLYRNLRQNSEH